MKKISLSSEQSFNTQEANHVFIRPSSVQTFFVLLSSRDSPVLSSTPVLSSDCEQPPVVPPTTVAPVVQVRFWIQKMGRVGRIGSCCGASKFWAHGSVSAIGCCVVWTDKRIYLAALGCKKKSRLLSVDGDPSESDLAVVRPRGAQNCTNEGYLSKQSAALMSRHYDRRFRL